VDKLFGLKTISLLLPEGQQYSQRWVKPNAVMIKTNSALKRRQRIYHSRKFSYRFPSQPQAIPPAYAKFATSLNVIPPQALLMSSVAAIHNHIKHE